MISKKLLKKVMKLKQIDDIYIEDNLLYFCELNNGINIYELANECKEWALSKGWAISSGVSDHISKVKFATVTNDCFNSYKTVNSNTEVEAIFKACEWILKEKLTPKVSYSY